MITQEDALPVQRGDRRLFPVVAGLRDVGLLPKMNAGDAFLVKDIM